MPRDLGIAGRLRAAGCKVVEVDGWRTRGSDTFSPRGSVDHHTAGAARGNAPSLGICINGRSDLPGPLCQVLVARDLTCYLIAAGRANHAGPGGWKGLAGNSSVYGVERENVGTAAEPWTPTQTNHAAIVHRALMDGKSAEFVCRHAEWAPTRKIDTHSLSGSTLRSLVAKETTPTPTPPTPDQGDDMPPQYIIKSETGDRAGKWGITDGLWWRHIDDRTEAGILVGSKLAVADGTNSDGSPKPFVWPAIIVDDLRDVNE